MGNTCTTDKNVKDNSELYQLEENPLHLPPSVATSCSAQKDQEENDDEQDDCATRGVIGRANSEPSSPQAVPLARGIRTDFLSAPSTHSSNFSIPTPNESLGYDFEGPLTPVGPVKDGEIHRWLSESGSDSDCTTGPVSPTEVDRLGGSYEHFEDNAEAFLAEAAEVARQEKIELRKKRQAEADALRRKKKSNSFLQTITFALTGKA